MSISGRLNSQLLKNANRSSGWIGLSQLNMVTKKVERDGSRYSRQRRKVSWLALLAPERVRLNVLQTSSAVAFNSLYLGNCCQLSRRISSTERLSISPLES